MKRDINKEKNPNWKGGVTFLICKTCGNYFRGYNGKIYCSNKCYLDDIRNYEKRFCLTCGEEIKINSNPAIHNKRKFCSLDCAYTNRNYDIERRKNRITFKCKTCGVLFKVTPHRKKTANFCSKACKIKYSKGKCFASANKIQKREIKKRLNYEKDLIKRNFIKSVHSNTYQKLAGKNKYSVCFSCGSNNKLEVHHIDGNRLNNNPTNLRILCVKCHKNTHRRR